MRSRFAAACVLGLFASNVSAQTGVPVSPSAEAPAPGAPGAAPTQNGPLAPATPAPASPTGAPVEAPPPSAAPTPADAPPASAVGTPGEAQPAASAAAPASPPGAIAQPDAAPAAEAQPDASSGLGSLLSRVQIHGFVSEGGFISTSNEYIGQSSRGSLKMLEAGVNFSVQLLDQLRVGVQLVARDVGTLSEDTPRLDWAVIDYRFQPWFGLRGGVIKLPLGLYNEYEDIDSARTAILMPQSLYPIRNRDALISHTGFAAYGNISLGGAGALDYQAWLGTLTIPRSALELGGATLNSTDTKYVTGAQLFWRTPVDGLRVGGTFMQASIDFDLTLTDSSVTQLVAAGALPAGSTGGLLISQRPTRAVVASAEYTVGDWLFAAEYSRWLKHQQSSLPQLLPAIDEDSERFYGLATYRASSRFELGTYYSVTHADASDRTGKGPKFKKPYLAFQRDLAATIRFDVNDYWLWKLEGHFIDGVSELDPAINPNPHEYWGMFLCRTTVTF